MVRLPGATAVTLAGLAGAWAVAEAEPPSADDEVEVVAVVAPLTADAVAAANGQAATAEAIAASGSLDLSAFLAQELASVFVNEAQGNPLQPDVQYRGFVGSPLLGLPQGIAVYQDAVRVNEPFGDTVNWALIPKSAIDRVLLLPGASPLFGLNALGGAIAITTKDGFNHAGASATLSAGQFGRRAITGEAGGRLGATGGYFATVSTLREDGWRDYSPSAVDQAFVKLSWRGSAGSLDASVTAVETDLIGNGAAPVELLAENWAAVFTRPDRTRNDLRALNLLAERGVGAISLRGALYWRRSDIATYNGDDSEYAPCEDGVHLCLEDEDDEAADDDEEAAPVFDANGRAIPALPTLTGATVNRTRTAQSGAGFSIEAQRQGELGTARHRLAVGLAYDSAGTGFRSSTELGRLDATRLAVPGGVLVGDAFTRVDADVDSAALHVSDALRLGERLRLTAAVRFNRTRVALDDRLGTALDGKHSFSRLNPAFSAAFALTPRLTAYAAYGEANRAPSPVELTCADPDAPCRLPNAFLADPPLAQVVARTLEAGLRGDGAVAWRLGVFEARSEDDILFISAGPLTSQGYFDNVGSTRRRGLELSLTSGAAAGSARFSWFLHATALKATFEEAFAVPSPHHPLAAGSQLAIAPGDRLPLIPARLFKAGASLQLHPRLTLSGRLLHAASARLRGDEANLAPPLASYTVLNLRLDLRLAQRLRIFADVDNVLNERYATFGVFGDADEVLGDGYGPRFLTPAAPRGAWLGVELKR